jgi:hypothetical protein
MLSTKPLRRGPAIDVLRARLDQFHLDPDITEPQRSALLAVLTAPVAFSWIHPPHRTDDRKRLRKALRRARIPKPAAEAWIAGLVYAGHTEDTLADLKTADLLARWELGKNIAVTLTPFAAAQLGAELKPMGKREPAAIEFWGPVDLRRKRRPVQLHPMDQVLAGNMAQPHLAQHLIRATPGGGRRR